MMSKKTVSKHQMENLSGKAKPLHLISRESHPTAVALRVSPDDSRAPVMSRCFRRSLRTRVTLPRINPQQQHVTSARGQVLPF